MDVHSKTVRSYNMSRIRGSKTQPELKLRKMLKVLGFTYQPKGIYGKPDFANKKNKIALFVDGCFWHGCQIHYQTPKSHKAYWVPKIAQNIKRDSEVNLYLKSTGWRVIRIWEHEIDQL